MFKVLTKGHLYPREIPTHDDEPIKLFLFRPEDSSELVHLVPYLRELLPTTNFVTGDLATITITRLANDARALSIQARGIIHFNRLNGRSSLCVGRNFDLVSQLCEGEYTFVLELHERDEP